MLDLNTLDFEKGGGLVSVDDVGDHKQAAPRMIEGDHRVAQQVNGVRQV